MYCNLKSLDVEQQLYSYMSMAWRGTEGRGIR
jgi:hypothetical protein